MRKSFNSFCFQNLSLSQNHFLYCVFTSTTANHSNCRAFLSACYQRPNLQIWGFLLACSKTSWWGGAPCALGIWLDRKSETEHCWMRKKTTARPVSILCLSTNFAITSSFNSRSHTLSEPDAFDYQVCVRYSQLRVGSRLYLIPASL